MRGLRIFAGLILLALAGCSLDMGARALYVLVDVSGTYHRELPKAVNAVRYLVAEARPNDFLALAKISSRSFSDREVIFARKFPSRPSEANAVKRELKREIDAFARTPASAYTDIHGALYQSVHQLQDKKARLRAVILFSDLVEDIAGVDRSMKLPDMHGVHVLAVDVIKLRKDNRNPRNYYRRIERWRKEVLSAGAESFTVVDDASSLPEVLRQLEERA